MGYYNPIHAYGTARFGRMRGGRRGRSDHGGSRPEEERCCACPRQSRAWTVRFVTPTTDDARLAHRADGASGYLYYVSVAGVTGTKTFTEDEVRAPWRGSSGPSDLPCAVGFGIRTREQAAAIARMADGVVVGSAIVRPGGTPQILMPEKTRLLPKS